RRSARARACDGARAAHQRRRCRARDRGAPAAPQRGSQRRRRPRRVGGHRRARRVRHRARICRDRRPRARAPFAVARIAVPRADRGRRSTHAGAAVGRCRRRRGRSGGGVVTIRGCAAVVNVECVKLAAQIKARAALAVCAAGPFAFAAAMRVQSSLPEDTLFGRSVKESGFAVPLVVLGFAALWVFPLLASVVGGDVFSAEDRYGTWSAVLTRSRSRGEVFTGKVLTALAFSSLAVAALAVSSVAAGVLVVGPQPLINLSGTLLPSAQALIRVALAWASVLPPAFAFTALAVLLSVATRSSAAGIGLP